MSTLNETDILFVERNGQLYQITSDQMSTLNDTDLLLVERSGTLYKLEAQDLDLGPTGSIDSPVEVLTPLNGAGVGPGAPYNPISSEITAIGGSGTSEFKTSEITEIDLDSIISDFAIGGTTTTSAPLAGPIVLPPAGQLRKVALFIAGTNGIPQLGFSQNFSGTSYNTDFGGQYFNSQYGVWAVEGSGLGNGPSGSTGGQLRFLDDGSFVTFSNGRKITFVYDSQGNVWGYVDGRAITTDSILNPVDPTAGSNGRPMITGLTNSYYAGVQYQWASGTSQTEVVAGDDLGFNKILSLTDDTNLEQFTVGATVQGVSSLTSYVGWNGHPASSGYYGGWGNSASWDGLSVNDAAGGGSSSGPGRNSTPKTLVGGFNDVSVGDWGTSSGGTEGWVIDMGQVVYAEFATADSLKTTDASDQIYGAGTAGTALSGGGYGGTGRFFWLVYNGQPSAGGLDVTLEQGVTIVDKDASATPPTLTVTGGSWDTSLQDEVWTERLYAGTSTYDPSANTKNFQNSPTLAFDGNDQTITYENGASQWIYFRPTSAIAVQSTIEFYSRNTVEVKVNGSAYSYTGGTSDWTVTKRTVSFSGNLTEFAVRDLDNTGSSGLAALYIDGKAVVDVAIEDQVWTKTVTVDYYGSAGPGNSTAVLSKLFDNNLTTGFYVLDSGASGAGLTHKVTFPTAIPGSLVEVWSTGDAGAGAAANGTTTDDLIATGNGVWTTLYSGAEIDITHILFGNVSGTRDNITGAIRIDGKMVIDTDVRDLGDRQVSVDIPYDLTLTCTDDTELRYMVGPVEMTDENGDLIVPQTSSITSVVVEAQNSQVWSDNISPAAGGSGWNGSYDITKAFTGNSCSIVCAGTSNDGATVTLTINPAIPVTNSIRWNHFSPALSGITYNNSYTLDGVTTQVSGNSSTVLAEGVSGMLSQLTWQATGDGDRVTYLNYILIDGKRLVDQGITPPSGHEPETILTFADNTDFQYFEAGDTVAANALTTTSGTNFLTTSGSTVDLTNVADSATINILVVEDGDSGSAGGPRCNDSHPPGDGGDGGASGDVFYRQMTVGAFKSAYGNTFTYNQTNNFNGTTVGYGGNGGSGGTGSGNQAGSSGSQMSPESMVTTLNSAFPELTFALGSAGAGDSGGGWGGGGGGGGGGLSITGTGVPATPSASNGSAGADESNGGDGGTGWGAGGGGGGGEGWRTCTAYPGGAGAAGLAIVYITNSSYETVTVTSVDSSTGVMNVDGGTWTTGSGLSKTALQVSATDVIDHDGNSIYLAGITGTWYTGNRIKGSQVSAAAPSPSAVTFTSSNGGTTAFSGTDATLASRTWTLQTGSSATGPWTTLGAYEDFDASVSQDGATPWVTSKPTLNPNTYYQVKVRYNSTNANSVESSYNTFQTGDA